MTEKLKPCPFCSSSNVLVDKGILENDKLGNYFVICDKCHVTGPAGYTEQQAIEAWNKRANEELLCKLLQAMCDIRAEKNACRKEDNDPAFMMALIREDDIFKQAEAFLQQEVYE